MPLMSFAKKGCLRMSPPQKTKISERELKQMICARLGYTALLTVHRRPEPISFGVGIITTPDKVSTMQALIDRIVEELRATHELKSDDVPELASEPAYEPSLQTIFFEFWKDGIRHGGSLRVPHLDVRSALRFFHQHWPEIGAMAAKTPPSNGEVKLVVTG